MEMDIHGVKEVVTGVLRQKLAKNGYSNADVKFEEDFDGEEVIRVTVHLREPVVNMDELYDSVHVIRNRLAQAGDNRFVFLRQDYPGADDFDDEDEDRADGAHLS
jgi:hypothetical protein